MRKRKKKRISFGNHIIREFDLYARTCDADIIARRIDAAIARARREGKGERK